MQNVIVQNTSELNQPLARHRKKDLFEKQRDREQYRKILQSVINIVSPSLPFVFRGDAASRKWNNGLGKRRSFAQRGVVLSPVAKWELKARNASERNATFPPRVWKPRWGNIDESPPAPLLRKCEPRNITRFLKVAERSARATRQRIVNARTSISIHLFCSPLSAPLLHRPCRLRSRSRSPQFDHVDAFYVSRNWWN